MEIIDKPSKMKLRMAAEIYFYQNKNAKTVGIRTKEGREFWFRRDPISGEPIKISQADAERV